MISQKKDKKLDSITKSIVDIFSAQFKKNYFQGKYVFVYFSIDYFIIKNYKKKR